MTSPNVSKVRYLHEVLIVGIDSDTAVKNNAIHVKESFPTIDNKLPQNEQSGKQKQLEIIEKGTVFVLYCNCHNFLNFVFLQ